MSKVHFFHTLFAVFAAFLLTTSGAYSHESQSEFLRTIRAFSRSCSRHTPCLWALCVWSQYVTVDADNCMFIPSGCKCPRGTRCRRTPDVTPDNGYLTVPFTCQE